MNSPLLDFSMKIAGRTVAVRGVRETTCGYCARFFCHGEPDLTVEITAEDLSFERRESARVDMENGLPVRAASDAELEISALLRKTAERLLEYDVLFFHGSVVAVDGAAYLFAAKSGTGKSTHTRLWRQMLGSRAVMINDDKPFLGVMDNGVIACGSPWNGKHRLGTNTSAPLKAICILERGTENRIRQIPANAALRELFEQTLRPRDVKQIPQYMDLLDKLARQVTFYRLSCNMEIEAAQAAYEAMAQNQ